MRVKDLVSILHNYLITLIEKEGWGIFLKARKVSPPYRVEIILNPLYKNYTEDIGNNISPIELPTFKYIRENNDLILSQIDPIDIDLNDTPYIVFEYRKKLLKEFNDIILSNKLLLNLNNLVNRNNYNHIKAVFIRKFLSIEDINLNKIEGNKEVYFVGENGDGKSLILMGIHLAFNQTWILKDTKFEDTGKFRDLAKLNNRNNIRGIDVENNYYFRNYLKKINNFYAYGATRTRYSKDNPEKYGFMSLYDSDQQLFSPEEWLRNKYISSLENKLETKTGNDFLNNGIELSDIKNLFLDVLENNVEIIITSQGIGFLEKGYQMDLHQLSEGYKSIFIWISDLIFRLENDNPNITNLANYHGVVLVDEIELHLHPLWQNVIVSKLRLHFPGIQFIFTTLSPTIIQGASDDSILYKVYREKDSGITKISEPYYKKDLNHLMFNSLVTSPLIGLPDARLSKNISNPDTSDSYLESRINEIVKLELSNQKKTGKVFITKAEIDNIIKEVLNEQLKNDKNQ